MFFWLPNIPTSFYGYINKILAKKIKIFVIIYPNNIFIYTKNPSQDNGMAVYKLLNFLKKKTLFVNFKKSWLYKDEIFFRGYILFLPKPLE